MSLHELAGPRQPYESYIRRQDAATPPHLREEEEEDYKREREITIKYHCDEALDIQSIVYLQHLAARDIQ